MASKIFTVIFALLLAAAETVHAAPATTVTISVGAPTSAMTSTVYVTETPPSSITTTNTPSSPGTTSTAALASYVMDMGAEDMMSMVMSVNDQMASDMMSAMSASMSSMNLNIWYGSFYMSQAAATSTAV